MSCKHKQAEPPPSHRKQDPVLFQIQEFQHIFKSLPNPRETPREKLYDLHPRTAWNYTRVCRTYTEDVSRFDVSSLWLISPYITNRSSRSSPLEISRGRKRERESEMGQAIWRGRFEQVFDSRSRSVDFILISLAEREERG